MKEGIKQLIKTFHQRGLPEIKNRDLDHINLKTDKIISLIGSRRVGKTYSCFQLIKKIMKEKKLPIEYFLYINFEDERVDFKAENLQYITDIYQEMYPKLDISKCFFFFDEIQEVTNWEKFVRRVYDNYTKNIIITGSSSKLLSKEIATSLRGRSLAYNIFPLSFREYLSFKEIPIDFYNEKNKFLIKKEFNEYIKKGCFPETIFYDDITLQKTYQEYLNVMIFKDIIDRYNIKNREVLNIFIKKTISNIGVDFSINKFVNEIKSEGLKVSKDFLYELPNYLEDIFLVFFLEKYEKSQMKRSLSSKKAYTIDSGFSNLFKFNEDYGRILENGVFIELKRKEFEIYFHRNLFECDFIIKQRDTITHAIQVTKTLSDEETRTREIKGLLEAMDEYGLNEGLILTDDEEGEETINNKKITIRPIWKWLLIEA